MTAPLTDEQCASYWVNGYLFLPDALSSGQLSMLREDFAKWVEESALRALWADTRRPGQVRPRT